jgi:hypothetical protein
MIAFWVASGLLFAGSSQAHHQPQAGPRSSRAAGPEEPGGPLTRPHQQADERVQDDRAGCPGERVRGAGEQHPEPLAKPPHPERPRERQRQRRPDRASVQQPEPDEHLNQREERVEHGQVVLGEVGGPVDAAREPGGLTRRHAGQDADETL